MPILIFILIFFITPIVIAFLIYESYEKAEGLGCGFVVAIALSLLSFYPYFALFGGLLPNYSEGERQGYITKYSQKGIIFRTNEGELQLGTGNMASLQEPFSFSVVEEEIDKKVREGLGRKVRVEYRQWFLQPFKRGKSSYEIVDLEILDE